MKIGYVRVSTKEQNTIQPGTTELLKQYKAYHIRSGRS